MLTVTSTPHLTGITIEGNEDELRSLYDAVWVLVGPIEIQTTSLNAHNERLLALCYDLRHAQIDSTPKLKHTRILWPEAMFEVMMLNYLIERNINNFWGINERLVPQRHPELIETYNQERKKLYSSIAIVRYFQYMVLSVFHQTVGEKRFKTMPGDDQDMLNLEKMCPVYFIFLPFIDQLNLDYLNWDPKKRPSYLVNVIRKLINYDHYESKKLQYDLNQDMKASQVQHLSDLDYYFPYPQDIEW